MIHVPEAARDAWPCWRLVVVEELATWTEVNTCMTIEDVEMLLDVCDAVHAAEAPTAK